MHNHNGHDALLRAMTRTHPWSARISCDFFKVAFDAAFRRMVQLYLKQERISPRELGLAVDDELLVKRLDEGRKVRLATADTVFEVMGQPPLGTLFLKEVEAYLEITETKADTLGLEAVRDRLFVTKLREGHSPYLGAVDKVRGWMGAHSRPNERRAIGAATLHRSWFRHSVGGLFATAEGYLTTEQAAKFLAVSTRWLEAMRFHGGGPPYYKVHRAVRYRRQDLDEWARSKRRLHTSDDGTASAKAVNR